MCLPWRIVGIITTIIQEVRHEYNQLLRVCFRVLFMGFVENDVAKATRGNWLTH